MKAKGIVALASILVLVASCWALPLFMKGSPSGQPETAASPPSITTAGALQGVQPKIEWTTVAFDDIAPAGMNMQQCWNGMGMDNQGRIYIGFTSIRGDGREDFPVFRYDPASGRREFLGTFLDVVSEAGNARPGESIPKGHTRMIYADGKMYMGSQSFHDLKWEIDTLPTFRGGHLFAFDTAGNSWEDLSASLPGGVVMEHEGIVSLNILPQDNLLVGLAHPSSDIVLYDLGKQRLAKIAPGIPWRLGNPLSREIIVAPSGNIYTYRGTEAVAQRHEIHSVWVYNVHTGEMRDMGFRMTNGFWIGQTETRDHSKIFINTTGGEIYEFDVASETFRDLGYELPKTDDRIIDYTYAITLSPDEKRIYYILSVIQNPGGPEGDGSGGTGELYYYDLATGQIVFVEQLPVGIYTSADSRDDKNLYFSHFGTPANIWSGKPELFIVHVQP